MCNINTVNSANGLIYCYLTIYGVCVVYLSNSAPSDVLTHKD